jgi:hypothetical protein
VGWEITYKLRSQPRSTNNLSIHELKVKKGGPKTSLDVLNVMLSCSILFVFLTQTHPKPK